MSSTVSPKSARFDEDTLWVQNVGVPLVWFPRLLKSTPGQREQVRLSNRGLHWDALDEDISVAGSLAASAIGALAARPSRPEQARPASHLRFKTRRPSARADGLLY